MKQDENETLCWIMRWGWMTWKWSLAFNNDDGKKLYNLKIYLQKKIKPAVFLVCSCIIPWNGNQKQIKGNFSISNQEGILKFVVDWFQHALAPFRTIDNNLHWPLSVCPH